MRTLDRALAALTLVTALGAATALAPAPLEAQGKGHKYGQHKEKGDKVKNKDASRGALRGYEDRDDDRDEERSRVSAWPGQSRATGARSRSFKVPPGHMPPAGMCRIWIDGVPPGRQPAPTDCATAERTRPANARVIYGSDRGSVATRSDSRGTAWPDGRTDTPTQTRRGGGWPYPSSGDCRDTDGDGRIERTPVVRNGKMVDVVCH